MKFLLIILAIRLLVGALTKKNKSDQDNAGEMKKDIFHPAEFDLR
jgi:hypothetical protein